MDHRNQTQCNVWPASGGEAPTNDFGWGYTCDLPDSTTTYSYDAADNRTSQGGSYDDGNRITALEGFTFAYDADGNVTSKSGNGLSRTYSWDAANRLVSIAYSGPSGSFTAGFNYDASGRLVRRTRDGATERWYLWDGAQLIAELDSSFKRVGEYVYAAGIDQPLAMVLGDTLATSVEYLVQDSRGNVIGSRVGSAVQQTITYKSWGGRSREGTSANNLSWKGLLAQSQDDVLYYMRSRWYDSNTGRFLSEDPLGLSAGINQYAFAGNDPINGWDPSGLCWISRAFDGSCPPHAVVGRADPERWAHERWARQPWPRPAPGPGDRSLAGNGVAGSSSAAAAAIRGISRNATGVKNAVYCYLSAFPAAATLGGWAGVLRPLGRSAAAGALAAVAGAEASRFTVRSVVPGSFYRMATASADATATASAGRALSAARGAGGQAHQAVAGGFMQDVLLGGNASPQSILFGDFERVGRYCQ